MRVLGSTDICVLYIPFSTCVCVLPLPKLYQLNLMPYCAGSDPKVNSLLFRRQCKNYFWNAFAEKQKHTRSIRKERKVVVVQGGKTRHPLHKFVFTRKTVLRFRFRGGV